MKTQINIRKKMLVMLLIITFQGIPAVQAQKKKMGVTYMAFVELMDREHKLRGLLYAVHDSALVLFVGKDPVMASDQTSNYHFKTIPVSQIYQVKLRPKGKVSRSAMKGVLYGTLVGAAFGGLNAVANEDDFFFSDGDYLLSGVLSGAVSGAIFGVILGSLKTKIPINGNQQRFSQQAGFLKGHAYQISESVVSPSL